jgi:NAD(P)-dependent dehydrogenase (short-subunit alcohol dehydrogenase family)
VIPPAEGGRARLQGRVAVITGSSRGIGANLARRFASEGAAVAVVARTEHTGESRFSGTIHETVASITAAGGQAVAVPADLSRPADVASIGGRVEEALGPIDILVNNAGINRLGVGIEGVELKHVRLFFEIMVQAAFALCQQVVPGMQSRRDGWILNISSKMARHPKGPPYPDWARDGSLAHGMGKAALDRLSTGLAAETYGAGIRVNSLGPCGAIVTEGVRKLDYYVERHRVFEQPPEWMDEAAVRLCSGGPDLTGGIWTDVDVLGLPDENWIWTKAATF